MLTFQTVKFSGEFVGVWQHLFSKQKKEAFSLIVMLTPDQEIVHVNCSLEKNESQILCLCFYDDLTHHRWKEFYHSML